jgi:hypothetical protein
MSYRLGHIPLPEREAREHARPNPAPIEAWLANPDESSMEDDDERTTDGSIHPSF